MKILFVSSLFPPSVGGGENYVKWTAEALALCGQDVSVFTANTVSGYPEKINHLSSEEIVNGVYVRRFQVNNFINGLCSSKTDHWRGAYRLKNILFGETMGFWQHGPIVSGMHQAIKDHDPDIIVAVNNYFFTTYLAYLAHEEFGIPLAIVPLSHTSNPWTSESVLKKIYNNSDAVVVSTDFEKNFLLNQGTEEEKLHVLGHGINPLEFDHADGQRFRRRYDIPDLPLVSFIGRKINGKGVDTLIKAMRLVWEQERDVQLALVGPDGGSSVVHEQLMKLSLLEKAKTFNINHFRDEEKKDIFAASDIFAMPSNVDSFGLTYLEAWRSGVPVIACRETPQESFMQHGKDALLVDYGHVQKLAEAILLLLKDRDLRLRLGQNGQKKFFEQHTLDIYAKNLLAILTKVLDKKNLPHLPSLELSEPCYPLQINFPAVFV